MERMLRLRIIQIFGEDTLMQLSSTWCLSFRLVIDYCIIPVFRCRCCDMECEILICLTCGYVSQTEHEMCLPPLRTEDQLCPQCIPITANSFVEVPLAGNILDHSIMGLNGCHLCRLDLICSLQQWMAESHADVVNIVSGGDMHGDGDQDVPWR